MPPGGNIQKGMLAAVAVAVVVILGVLSPRRHREAKRSPERHREAQQGTESHRELQRATKKPREAQRGTEGQRAVPTLHKGGQKYNGKLE